MGMVAHRVSGRDPPQEPAHFTLPVGPQDQMPVVRHQLVAEQLHVGSFPSRGQNAFKRFVISFLAENPRAGVATIQGMIQATRFVGSCWSWHGNRLTRRHKRINGS